MGSDQIGEQGSSDYGHESCYGDSQTAHGPFDFAHFHGFGCADRMGGRAQCQSLCDRLFDAKQFEYEFCNDISQNPGDDNDGYRDRGNTAKLFGDAQADGGGDGFGEQRHILFVIKAEQLCQQENAHKAGQDAGGDAAGHGFYIILKQGELPVKRHGKAYGGRREQIADIARAFAVVAVFHMQKRQYCHDADCSDQQWI